MTAAAVAFTEELVVASRRTFIIGGVDERKIRRNCALLFHKRGLPKPEKLAGLNYRLGSKNDPEAFMNRRWMKSWA